MKTGRPIEVPGQRFRDKAMALVAPSALGAHNWHPMAFSPKTGLVYLPAQEVPFAYQTDPNYVHKQGAWNIAVIAALNAPPNDPAATRATRAILKGGIAGVGTRWRRRNAGAYSTTARGTAARWRRRAIWCSRAMPRASSRRFDATTGAPAWSFDAQTGVIAGPVSFKVGDTQYVAVMAGYGGAYPLSTGFPDGPQRVQPNGRVLVFKLGGTATLPPYDAPQLAAPNPPKTVFTAQQIARGGNVYEGNCGVCHGAGARSSGLVPDLRRSAALSDAATWAAVVHGGILKDQGMVSFAKMVLEGRYRSRARLCRRAGPSIW